VDVDEPIGLPEEAWGGRVPEPRAPIDVYAWVPYRDGYYHPVKAQATAWTDRAVRIRWKVGAFGAQYELWVWAKAVTRREGRVIEGPLATDRPELVADVGPRRPAAE
jgi:hypothetical protein